MTFPPIPPEVEYLLAQAAFPPHFGLAQVRRFGHLTWEDGGVRPDEDSIPAIVTTTVSGESLVLAYSTAGTFCNNLGSGLSVAGEYHGRPFSYHAPQFYGRAPRRPTHDNSGWTVLVPINEPSTLTYGDTSAEVATVQAYQFNLDLVEDGGGDRPLVVRAAGREVRLLPAPNHQAARFLLASGAIRYAPLTTINFAAWESATETDLLRFATGVAGLCGLVIQGQANLSHVLFCDKNGQPVKVVFYTMIRTEYRDRHLLLSLRGNPHGLPQLFSECYEEYERLCQQAEWSSLFQMAMSCEEGLFVEHRAAAVYAALEKLFRNCLVESGGMTRQQAEDLLLPKLVGAARHRLSWSVPGHYTRGNRHLDIRNSVAHGNSFPYSTRAVIDNYEMWKLFLFRRILIRLRYTGMVRCFSRGYSSFSSVDDFSEDQNCLGLEHRREDPSE